MEFLTKKNNKIEYLNYLNNLSIQELENELSSIKHFKNILINTYDMLISLIRNDFLFGIQNELDNESSLIIDYLLSILNKLKVFLLNDVSKVFDYNCNNDNIEENLTKEELIKQIKSVFQIVFEPTYLIEEDNSYYIDYAILKKKNFKELNYSYYQALKLLQSNLLEKVDLYLKIIESDKYNDYDNLANLISKIIVETAEEYSDVYINYDHEIKSVMTEEQYEILVKYNCVKYFVKMINEGALVALCLDDLKYCFENANICKIINNGKEIILTNDVPSIVIFCLYVDHDCDLKYFNSILNEYNSINGVKIEEALYGCYYGENNIFAIYLSKK